MPEDNETGFLKEEIIYQNFPELRKEYIARYINFEEL